MIVADVLGPWHDVEVTATDPETRETYTSRDQRRQPQFEADFGAPHSMTDITGQRAESITPDPPVCVWRFWMTPAQLALVQASEGYVVLRYGEVEDNGQVPAGW